MLHNDVLSTIGDTPLVRLNNILAYDGKARLYAKLEFTNPAGSIKDRPAYYMLKDALDSGKIDRETVIIEPTSGNTGIGLSMACAVWGMRLILTMPENMSEERRKILKAYGARIVLTDKSLGMKGAIKEAEKLRSEIPNSYIPAQFENSSNKRAHYETTAEEIFRDLPTTSAVVAGVGSGGTLCGIGEWVGDNGKNCRIIAVEPKESAVLSGEKAGAHKLQGIGAGFITKITNAKLFDKIVKVGDEDAYRYARLLANKEGILGGVTSGANLWAAIEMSKEIEGDIVFIVPDTGMRYLTGDLYE